MARTMKARVERGETVRVVVGEFSDEECERLEKYLECADHLEASSIVRDQHHIGLRISVSKSGKSVQHQLPPDEAAESFLLRMRPVLLSREPTNFLGVAKILDRRFDDELVRASVDVIRRRFGGELLRGQVQVRAIAASGQELDITSEDGLQFWLNSEPYHRDPEKRRLLDLTHKLIPLDASKVLFYLQLVEKAKACVDLAQLIRVFRGDAEQALIR